MDRWDDAGWPAGVLTTADRARLAGYRRLSRFYDGEQWPDAARRHGRDEPRLTLNYARSLVRKVAAYVFPGPVTFTVEPAARPPGAESATGATAGLANTVEQALAATQRQLDLARLEVELCIEGAVLGDAAVKVTWDTVAGQPVVAPVDPATLVARWRPDHPRQLLSMTQAYGLTGDEVRAVFPDLARTAGGAGLAPRQVYPVVERWTASHWRVEIAGQVARSDANPYGAIPYVVVPNNPRPQSFWGESDLTDLIDVCQELNTRMSGLSQVLAVAGAPIAVLENVDGSEGISVGPGAKWELPEGARAYLLDLLSGGGVGLHVQYVDLLYRALHDLSETPRTAFGDAGRNLSGAALEVEVQPLLQKVQRKRRVWDAFYRQRNALLLDFLERFGGQPLGGLRQTSAVWPSVLPSDLDDAVRNATQLVAGGIHSRRTAITALGGTDPEGEFARMLAEQAALRELTPGPDLAYAASVGRQDGPNTRAGA